MNDDTAEYLREIAVYYTILNRKSDDHRRAATYKAAETVKALTQRLDTASEAKALPGIGVSIAQTIEQFAQHGDTSKLDELKTLAGDARYTIDKFTSVYGIGVVTAMKFYQAGYRNLEDIPIESLNTAQKIGLEFREEIATKLHRSEVTAIYGNVHSVLQPHVHDIAVVGSYRRGKATSGDIDILVSSDTAVLSTLVDMLHDAGILSHDLALGHTKYAGITSAPHRRIDIRLVGTESYPCALMYFTGSKDFNIVMRNRAKSMHLKLNEYYLTFDHDNTVVDITKESDIFIALDVDYVPPMDRVEGFTL